MARAVFSVTSGELGNIATARTFTSLKSAEDIRRKETAKRSPMQKKSRRMALHQL
jgi:hypothetical protein